MLLKLEKFMNKMIDAVGYLTGVLLLVMILNVAFDVMMRYVFNNSSIGMQEMEWHLFAVIILFGTGYGLKHDAHVRVDFAYERFSIKTKSLINIWGTILFIIPLIALIVYGSFDFVMDAYTTNEISEDPGGLPYRWIIKGMIPLAFLFLLFCSVNYIIHYINIYKGVEKPILKEEEMI